MAFGKINKTLASFEVSICGICEEAAISLTSRYSLPSAPKSHSYVPAFHLPDSPIINWCLRFDPLPYTKKSHTNAVTANESFQHLLQLLYVLLKSR